MALTRSGRIVRFPDNICVTNLSEMLYQHCLLSSFLGKYICRVASFGTAQEPPATRDASSIVGNYANLFYFSCCCFLIIRPIKRACRAMGYIVGGGRKVACFRNTCLSGLQRSPGWWSSESFTVKHSDLQIFVCFLKHLVVAQFCRFFHISFT